MGLRFRVVSVIGVGLLAAVAAGPAQGGEEKAVCPAEVSRAGAMVARAQDVLKGGSAGGRQLARAPGGDAASGAAVSAAPSPGTPTGGGHAPQGGPASGAGSSGPEGRAGAARGLATSGTSEITPWTPSPTDRTLNARTAKAEKLTAQARRLCRAGKLDEAKARANEAITVLDPK